MTKKEIIKVFEERKVRTIWDDKEEKWYFSIVDVVVALTDSDTPQTYWRVLKNRLKKEGNETVTNCNALKLRAADGKMYVTISSSVRYSIAYPRVAILPRSPEKHCSKLTMTVSSANRYMLSVGCRQTISVPSTIMVSPGQPS